MSKQTPNQKDLESIKAIHNQLETLEGSFQSATNSTRLTLQQHQKQIQTLTQAIDNLNSNQSKLSNNNSNTTTNNQQISILELNEKVNQLLQNQNKILSLENTVKALSTEISILKKQKNLSTKDSQFSSESESQEIEQIKNELNELKEQMATRPTLRLVERSIQNELERQQNISSFEKQNQNASEISSIKHEIQLLKQQIQSDKSISQISELKNTAKELKEKLQSKDDKKSTHPDEFCQQMRNELTFLEENFIEAYNFNTISLASQAKQIKQLRHIIMSPYDYDESEENSSNENSEDEENDNNSKRRIPDSNTRKLKNIIQNLQESVKKQTEADHAVLRCLKYEIKKLKSQEALASIENSINSLRDQISNIEEKENDKIEALQDKLENAQNKLKKLRLFNGKDDAEDGDLDNSTFFDGSVDSLRAHLAKLDAEVKEFRQQLQKSKTDSEDIEKSITNIVNCLKHEMKKVRNNQSALTNHLKEKGLVTSDLELEASSLSDDSMTDVKSRNINLPFEQVTSEKVPDGYYKIKLPDEPFDEIKKELYTLECNFIQTANVHATSIEDHYRQLEEIRKNLQQKKNIEPDSELSENKSEIIKSLKLEVQKLKQNGILTDQQMRGIEDMNNRIAAIEDYLQEDPEIVEIHPLDENGNSIQESNSTQETLIRPIIDTINAMAEEIKMIKDNYDVRGTIRCIKHELKKQSVDASQYKRSLTEKNQYQIKEINLRLDTIEDYLINETEEEEVKEDNKLNTLNDVISSMANTMSSMKSEMAKLKNVISVQNQELIPIKERLDAMEQERKRSNIQSKRDIEKLKQALDSIEPKTPQETLDAIENIMKQIEETMNKQDADRNTIRCLKHEMVKLKGPLEKAGQHNEEIERINNRLDTIEEYLQEDEPIVDIENAEEEEEEYEEDPTIQIGNVVASMIESMKSMKDEIDDLRNATYMKDNEAIRCVKHELKKLKCQIELQELLSLEDSSNAQLPNDYEEQIKRLRSELRTLESNFVDTANSTQGSISVNSLEIEKLKKRYNELQQLEKSLENDKGLTLKERLENLEHSDRCLKYEMKKLKYENEIKNILQEEVMSSSMNLSAEDGDSLNLSPESEAKINHLKEELRKLEKNFEETSNLHTNSLDIHEMQLKKLKQLITETDDKIGGKSLEDIDDKFNKQVSNLENLFTERLRKTNLNVHVIEKQIENLYTNHGLIPFYPTSFESVFDDEEKEIDTRAGYVKVTPSKVGGNQFLFIDKNLDVLFKAVNELRRAHIDGINEEGIDLIPDSEKATVSDLVNLIQNLDRKNKRLEKSFNELSEEFKKILENKDTQVLNLGAYYDEDEDASANEEESKRSANVDGEQLNQLQNEIAELRQIIQNKDSAENSMQIGNLLSLQDISNGEDEEAFKEITDEIKNNVSNMKNDVDNQIEELKNKIATLSQQIVESTEPAQEREVRLELNKDDWSSNSFNESSENFEIIKRDNQEIKENIDTLNQQIEGIKDAIAQHQKRIQKNEEGVTLRLDLLNQSEVTNDEQQQDIEDMQSDIQEIRDSLAKLTNSFGCIKHELKKLKSEFIDTKNRDTEFSEVIRLDDPKSQFINDIDDLKEEFEDRFKQQEADLASLKSDIKQLKDSNSRKRLEEPSGMSFTLSPNDVTDDINDLDEKIEDYKSKLDGKDQELANQLDNLEKNVNELSKNVKNLNNKYSEDKASFALQDDSGIDDQEIAEMISESTKGLHHSIRCLKYEIKRLKEEFDGIKDNQNQMITERGGAFNLADEYSSDNNDKNNDNLEKEIEEIVTIANEKLENDVKSIKNELDDIRNRLKEMKENEEQRIRDQNTFKLNETRNNSLIEEEEEDKDEEERKEPEKEEDFKHSLRCIKYEIKKLKNKFENLDNQNEKSAFILNEGSSFVSTTNNDRFKDELMEFVSNNSDDINNKINKLNDELNKLRNAIQQPNQNHENSIFNIDNDNNYDEFEELREKTNEISQSTNELKNSVGCLKYEVKRLKTKLNEPKEDSFVERDIFNINSENFGTINNTFNDEEFKEEMKKLISDSINDISGTIRCLKHEIKGLKGKIETIQNDQIKDEFVINDVSSLIQQEKDDDSIGCLKYEVKRLKLNVKQMNEDLNQIKNHRNHHQQKSKSEHNSFILTNDAENNDDDDSIGCIKYEVKRLKLNVKQINEDLDQIKNHRHHHQQKSKSEHNSFILTNDADNYNDDEYDRSLGCIKYEIKRLKEKVNNLITQQNNEPINFTEREANLVGPNNDSKSIDEITNDVRCLKYEIKRLKTKLNENDNKSFLIEPSIINNDDDFNYQQEQKQTIDEEEIKRIIHNESSQMDYSIKCMKYEIKRLKENLKDLRNKQKEEDVFTLRDQEIINDEIKEEINNIKSITSKLSEESTNSIGCLKYEVKKLKSLTSQLKEKQDEMDRDTFILESENHKEFEQEITEIQEDLRENKEKSNKLQKDFNSLKDEIENLKGNNNQNKDIFLLDDDENNDRSLKCIKYEIKRLKETVSKLNENLNEIKDNQENQNQQKSYSERNTFILDELNQNDDVEFLKFEVKKLKEKFKEFSNNNNNNNNDDIQDSIINATNPLNHSLRCVKYEVKKLKETMEHANKNISKLKYFYKQLSSSTLESPLQSPTKQSDNKDDDKLHQTIKSIKFEIRRLKENYKNINEKVEQNNVVQLQPENEEDEKLKQTVKALKFEVKRLKANYKEIMEKQKGSEGIIIPRDCEVQLTQSENFNNDEIEDLKKQISASNNEFKHTIRCLKYEIKQLKLKQQPNQIPIQKQKQNESDQFSLEVDLNDISSDAEIIISPSITVHEIQTSIRCMKYEIKKLKETVNKLPPNQEREVVMIQDNSNTGIDASEVEQMIDASNEKNLRPIKNNIKAIKEIIDKMKNKINKLSTKPNQNNVVILPDENAVDKSQIDTVNHSINCLKYEVKKLKENIKDIKQEQEGFVKKNASFAFDLSHEDNIVDNHTINCLKYEIKKLKENIKNMKQEQEEFVKKNASFAFDLSHEDNIADNHTINCLKYEVKKLKENIKNMKLEQDKFAKKTTIACQSNKNDINEIKQTLNTFRSKFKKLEETEVYTPNAYDNSELEELKQIINEAKDEFNHTIRCMKYEIKKIKDNNKPDYSTSIPDDLLDRLNKNQYDISCIKYELKKLKNQKAPIERSVPAPSTIPEDLLDRISDIDQYSKELRCIKYELKKLKERPSLATSEIPDDLLDQISENQHDINCLKYEVKKLKLQPASPTPISDDLLDQHSEELRCIKYELRKLKEQPTPTAATSSPSIPDDLLDRLSENEHNINCLKYEVKKLKLQPAPVPTPTPTVDREASSPTPIPDDLLDQISENQHDINCLKYEVKKLKLQPSSTATIPDDLLDRISDIDQHSEELRCIKYELRKLKERPTPTASSAIPDDLLDQISESQHDINCLKYEVKKLKLQPAPTPAPAVERTVPSPSTIPDDLLDRLEKVEKIANETKEKTESHDQKLTENEHDINCLKYEVKKLKLQPASSTIPDDLLDRISDIDQHSEELRCIKYELRKLKERPTPTATTSSSPIPDDLLDRISENEHDINCLKYEVKKLKLQPAPTSTPTTPTTPIPDNLLDRIAEIEDTTNDAFKTAKDTKEQTDSLLQKFTENQHDINCLKYEVKKLKLQPASPAPISDDLLDQHSEELRCIKYELRKLKEQPTPTPTVATPSSPSIPDDLLDRLSENEHNINCLKYEVKKLKLQPAPTPTPTPTVDREASSPTPISDDLLDRIAEIEDTANDASKTANDSKMLAESHDQKLTENQHDINCLKYEVKKLKLQPAPIVDREASSPSPISDDLLDRIAEIEDTTNENKEDFNKLENELRCIKYEIRKIKENPAQNDLSIPDDLLSTLNELRQDLKCIKYEVKKLKEQKVPHETADQAQMPDDLLDRISQVERLAKDANDKTESACNGSKEANIKSDDSAKIAYDAKQMSQEAVEKTNTVIQDMNKYQYELRCIKYELKKLKEQAQEVVPASEPVERAAPTQAAEIPTDLLDHLNKVEKAAKEANDKSDTAIETSNEAKERSEKNEENIENLQQALTKTQYELRCIKYELKKLKEKPEPTPTPAEPPASEPIERAAPTQTAEIPTDLLDRLNKVEKEAKEANDKSDTAIETSNKSEQTSNEAKERSEKNEENIENLQQTLTKAQYELRCIKYELKKLKEKPEPTPTPAAPPASEPVERAAPTQAAEIPTDLLDRLNKVEKAAKEANDKSDTAIETANKADQTSDEAKTKSDESARLANDAMQMSESAAETANSLRQDMTKLQYELRCIKYELKKLKEKLEPTPTQASEPVERAAPTQAAEIPTDLLDRLNKVEKAAKEANDKSDTAIETANKAEQTSDEAKTKSDESARLANDAMQMSESAAETANSLRQDMTKLQYELRCIKYELKKLKEKPEPTPTQASEPVERAAPTQAAEIPTDLLDRLNKVEKEAKEANDKSDSSIETSNEAKETAEKNEENIENLQQTLTKTQYELRCIKYELKKLKEKLEPTPTPAAPPASEPVERAAPTQTAEIPTDLLDRLNKVEKAAKEANDKSDTAIETANEAKETAENLQQTLTKTQYELRCIKYELKKLKEQSSTPTQTSQPEPETPVERTTPTQAASPIPDDLLDRLSEVEKLATETANKSEQASNEAKETTDSLSQELTRLRYELRCIKYEMKKLKEQPRAEPAAEPTEPTTQTRDSEQAIPSDILERLLQAEENAKDAKQISNDALQNSSESKETANSVRQDFTKTQYELRCIKYELKKLKEQSATQAETPAKTEVNEVPASEPVERAAPTQAAEIPTDLLDRLNKVERAAKEANDKSDSATETSNEAKETAEKNEENIENLQQTLTKTQYELRCIKYELKKLKEKPTATPTTEMTEPRAEPEIPVERAAPTQTAEIPSDLLDRLNKVEKAAKEANDKSDSAIEISNKSEQTSNEAKETAEKNEENIENLQQTLTKTQYELRCIKYELKKLKEQQPTTPVSEPTPTPAAPPASEPVERAAPTQAAEIPTDLLDRLNKVEKSAKEANDKSDTATETSNEAKEKAEKNEENIENLQQTLTKAQYELRCIKYELKKLKEKPEPTPTPAEPESEPEPPVERRSPTQTSEIPTDLLDRLSEIEKVANEANETSSKCKETSENNEETISTLNQTLTKTQYELRCIKYELKKLKEQSTPTTPSTTTAPPISRESSQTISDEFSTRLSQAEQKANEATQLASKSNNELESIKDEIKNLKETLSSSSQKSIPDNLLSRLSETENVCNETKQQIAALIVEKEREKEDLKCIKYELKKLKEGNQTSA